MTSNDRGSASIWVIACALLVLAGGYLIAVRTTAVLLRHRVETAADLAALAGANRIGIDAESCEHARTIAVANSARLDACSTSVDPLGRSGTVTVRVSTSASLPFVGPISVSASARAGRVSR